MSHASNKVEWCLKTLENFREIRFSGPQKSLIFSDFENVSFSSNFCCIFPFNFYIRFFSNYLKFEIEVFGKGVEKISAKDTEVILKLKDIKTQDF